MAPLALLLPTPMIWRGKITDSLNIYFSRQQTSAIRHFTVRPYNHQPTAEQLAQANLL